MAGAVLAGVATLTCGPRPGTEAAVPALGSQSQLPGGPPPPRAGLSLPSLAVAWSPPTLTAGDSEALAEALTASPAVEVLLGPGLAGWDARLGPALQALSPRVRVTSVHQAEQAAIVARPDALTAAREPGSGRPRYRAEGIELQETWLRRHDPSARSIVSVDAAPIDLAAWKALPAARVGGCEPAIRALAEGQEQGLAQLEGFLNHADALLWRFYSAELAAFVPEIHAELRAFADAEAPTEPDAKARYECGRAYWQHVQPYAACTSADRCAVAPRVVLSAGGARVAAPEPQLALSDRCPMLVGRDYPGELRQLGLDAAEAATAALDRDWSTLADRLGAVAEVHAVLEDICTPRRWRFAAADLNEARGRLGRVGDLLASPELAAPQAGWRVEAADLFVPGAGPMRQLARFDPGPAAVNHTIGAEARALREFVLSRAQCRAGHDPRPMSVLVADAESGRARFFGYLYAEELVCGDLPPLGRE
ncbi:hypothetical protein OV079_21465 [Nannocystis pusilla]|uniref:Uncharacterized protein n=1 Tax=Nannocystis pusilla TaxID=889268 RepID=A0A9X3EQ24_9BACT|nr:hypothetical protein [Nannocystis pusilla]MCY1008077.1 hypothetical protein [Nannocystis pusilla]